MVQFTESVFSFFHFSFFISKWKRLFLCVHKKSLFSDDAQTVPIFTSRKQ